MASTIPPTKFVRAVNRARKKAQGNLAAAIREAADETWMGTKEELEFFVSITKEVLLLDGGIDKKSPIVREIEQFVERIRKRSALIVSSLIIPERKITEGLLVKSVTALWTEIALKLGRDWSLAGQLTAEQWEHLIAGAFKKLGFPDVIITPRSGDLGRDIIARTRGVGAIKVLGSVKAYKPGHLVKHDDVRALLGVLNAEQDASKAILTTTSDFAPKIRSDPLIKPYLPTRLELLNGEDLQKLLVELAKK